ncbi:carbohydrate kinase family protein [Streptomyces ficellus]|uniref:Carbohydrate kinase family protein n=1 Tax=Streptomyces ficellus TaxID=1977088 RepID=A0A6I6F3U3_9ACTN|nr:carbohydrate kinase family protein [Streptomyces ficellus]QGV77501.1 carbohydrate kinase family protein [Streptomyces ficellus]
MRIAVTGSIATDHLMAFPGSFTDQLLADSLDKISLSFLVGGLDVRRGGVAANIAYGLGGFGLDPVLVGAVGDDFAEYRVWLKEHGVDTDAVHVSATRQTARFSCVTDRDMNQIAAFYAGAMSEARDISIGHVAEYAGGLDLVLVAPNDPEAMLRHTTECRALGIPFASDPSQQLATLTGPQIAHLVEGATWLFTNEYEAALLLERTGWERADVLRKVGAWVTTLGADGARIERDGDAPVVLPAVPARSTADPTGVGDAFRAGFLAATGRGLPAESAARLGCALATTVLAAVGPQEYEVDPAALFADITAAYGREAAAEFTPWLGEAPR